MEDFCSFREVFDWDVSQKKDNIFSFHIAKIKLIYRIVYDYLLNLHQCSLVLEVSLGDEFQDVKLQVLLDKYGTDLFKICSTVAHIPE